MDVSVVGRDDQLCKSIIIEILDRGRSVRLAMQDGPPFLRRERERPRARVPRRLPAKQASGVRTDEDLRDLVSVPITEHGIADGARSRESAPWDCDMIEPGGDVVCGVRIEVDHLHEHAVGRRGTVDIPSAGHQLQLLVSSQVCYGHGIGR